MDAGSVVIGVFALIPFVGFAVVLVIAWFDRNKIRSSVGMPFSSYSRRSTLQDKGRGFIPLRRFRS